MPYVYTRLRDPHTYMLSLSLSLFSIRRPARGGANLSHGIGGCQRPVAGGPWDDRADNCERRKSSSSSSCRRETFSERGGRSFLLSFRDSSSFSHICYISGLETSSCVLCLFRGFSAARVRSGDCEGERKRMSGAGWSISVGAPRFSLVRVSRRAFWQSVQRLLARPSSLYIYIYIYIRRGGVWLNCGFLWGEQQVNINCCGFGWGFHCCTLIRIVWWLFWNLFI